MGDAKEVSLSEIIELIGGGTPKTSIPEYWDGDIPWLSVVDFNNGKKYVFDSEKKITPQGLKNSSTKILNRGDIIISARGTVGVIAVLGKQMAFNQSCYGVRSIKGLSTNDYIYYLLKDTVSNFLLIAHGGVFDTITRDTFNEIDVILPPLPEQKTIASVLSSLDDKIDLLHRQNKTLEAMAETLFRQWFDNYETKKHTLFQLKNLVKHIKPGTNYQPKRIESGIPFLNIRNLSNGFIDKSDIKYISDDEYSRVHKAWKPEENDILISRIGTLGIVALIRRQDLPIAVHYNMLNIKADKTSHQFLYFLLKSKYFQSEYDTVKRVSVQEYVAVEDAETIEIALPSSQERMQYLDEQSISLFAKTLNNYNQIRTLEKLRDTLLPKLMSGEVRVKT